MWMVQLVFDLLGPRGAAANAASVLDAHHTAMAEVDSVVARLHRHAMVRQPAA
jgi:hypothetical protein